MTDFVRDGVEGCLCDSDVEMVERLRQLVDDATLRHRISEHNRTAPSALTWQNAMAHNDAAYDLAHAEVRTSGRHALKAALDG
jgi:glycosyltransferase involved in cell wall biosynthesis